MYKRNLERLEKEIEKRLKKRDKKKGKKMRVSGGQVKKLQKIISKK